MDKPTKQQRIFPVKLMEWFAQNDRPMPWKGEKNPYLVWLSEIILQQTRVEQGLAYYERFKSKYSSIHDLAAAPEDEVMKTWEGLGYYSRARNLHATAKYISKELNGVFPNTYDTILTLKGVGPYTAAAIASFAFHLPHAVVDGNVYRVLSRYFGISTPIDSTKGKKQFATLANTLLDRSRPDEYNQAIIDFGATHCRPKKPLCADCLLQSTCTAFHEQTVVLLPIKEKKIKKKTRYFNYLLFNAGEDIFIRKRVEKDIWKHLYDFPLIEKDKAIDHKELLADEAWKLFSKQNPKMRLSKVSKPFQQTLTHQKIIAVFWEFHISAPYKLDEKQFLKVARKSLKDYAFPKIIDCYLQDNLLYLELL